MRTARSYTALVRCGQLDIVKCENSSLRQHWLAAQARRAGPRRRKPYSFALRKFRIPHDTASRLERLFKNYLPHLAKVLPSATRIQMTSSVVDILNSELPVYLQVPGLPERFVLLADTLLMVENTALPVHSQILAGSSPVFFDMFLTPLTSSKNEDSKLIVPLATDTLGNVCIALEYLYSRFANTKIPATFGDSLDEAEAVLAFAHKYGMQNILQECECCLMQAVITGTLELDVSEAAITWLALAEDCGLSTLLAHIELHIIKFSDSNFWTLSAYTRETIPKDSLLRITRGMSYYIDQQAFGAPICESHVNLPTLILWQTNFGASACEDDGGNIDDS